jgi:hypothetical protein
MAGTKTTEAPRKGRTERKLIIAPQNTGAGNPTRAKITPPSKPCRKPMNTRPYTAIRMVVDTRMVLFLAFVGGLIAFGPAGLILGPCIIAFTAGLAEVWQGRQATASTKADA